MDRDGRRSTLNSEHKEKMIKYNSAEGYLTLHSNSTSAQQAEDSSISKKATS